MKISLRLTDDLHKQLVMEAGKRQIQTGEIVAISDIIRGFIVSGLGGGIQEDTTTKEPQAARNTSGHGATEDTSKSVTKRKGSITSDPHKMVLFKEMQAAGGAGKKIADALGCSLVTVGRLRAALKKGEL